MSTCAFAAAAITWADFPRVSSGTSGFRLFGMIELPVDQSAGRRTSPTPVDAQ